MTTKKTVKKSTKKPSAKQLAARKKFAAAAKERAKKAAPKTRKTASGKRVRTEATKKARRAKNTVDGYYPNPVDEFVLKLSTGRKSYFIASKSPPYKITDNKYDAAVFKKNDAKDYASHVKTLLEDSGISKYKSVSIVKK